jgi:hypothetical protein
VALSVVVPSAWAVGSGVRLDRDVIVYGGTPAGVAAAIAAARDGARVTMLVAGRTVGGLMSNGLGATDKGAPAAVQGIAKEFIQRIRAYYGHPGTWRFEPRIAERVFLRMLAEARVQVRFNAPVTGVDKANNKITCVVVPTDRSYCAEAFVDASYTGDLLAGAGVAHRLGTRDLLAYGESLALRLTWIPMARAAPGGGAAFGSAMQANPFVRTARVLPPYSKAYRDGMPSLTYRLCVTTSASNRTPFGRPAAYQSLVPSFRYYAAQIKPAVKRTRTGGLQSDAYQLARLHRGKYDLNAGWRSFTNVPAPVGYFDSATSRQYWNGVLRGYVESFFYFVQHDRSVPVEVRGPFARFGLCKDEFVDNGNWPREPYVREARRIYGQYTMTEEDLYSTRTKSSAIAVGSYSVDGKLTQLVSAGGTLYRDIGAWTKAPVYEIPYGAIVPRSGPTNLLVPVAVSASPTAYGSLRVETQYMALGQAAGIAAALAAKHDRTVRFLPVSWVQTGLRADGVRFKALDICRAGSPAWRPHGGFDQRCTVVKQVKPKSLA